MKIEWDEKYEIGNIEIDSEHKVFVCIIQKINNAIDGKYDKHFIERLVNELLKYADFHFCSEENIMLDINYPDVINHKKEHEKLLGDLRNLIFAFEINKRNIIELVDFLSEWFVNHTVLEDKKIVNFLKKEEK